MALIEFFGCLFLAFGPPTAMFAITIAKDPIRVIILMTSSFFWLISLLISALVWFALVPLRNKLLFALVFSVFTQEVFRYLFYLFIKKAQKGLEKVQKNIHHKDRTDFDGRVISYVSGLGFGIISGAFSLVNVLGDMTGPGTVGIYGDSQYFFLVSAMLSLCFILLHTCWSIIMYLSLTIYPKKSVKLWSCLFLVVFSHLFVSCLSLANDSKREKSYVYTVLLSYIVLILNVVVSVVIVRKTYKQKLGA
ncbi:gamma-secretase subunit Aph-1 [Brachionus plicatilis]|uniref:Gamma-secretase subunit Aph-1 n=1 Tax=Brachionus plicatilis TaxID=10195 RepID=A0A3M7QTM3_BRAPC|nr:gamma-secretase subunit Aph-1 [Brachionus plicatilis]